MVCPPLDWMRRGDKWRQDLRNVRTRRLRDLTGGYLSADPGNQFKGIYSSLVSVLTTHDENHFNIHLVNDEAEIEKLIGVLNKLQGQPFYVNKPLLDFINKSWVELQRYGLVLPRILASIDRNEGIERLRKQFLANKDVMAYFNFNDLKSILIKNIQASAYEGYTIKLAEALVGYQFYLPVFLDFRGRNYRFGPFHYHERDLVRALILFAEHDVASALNKGGIFEGGLPANKENQLEKEEWFKTFAVATAFHYKKFYNYGDAYKWFESYHTRYATVECDNFHLQICKDAHRTRHPFQFMAGCTAYLYKDKTTMLNTPINQDASASAYQIMSYLLLDLNMAKNTNLLLDDRAEDRIHDIYDSMHQDLLDYLVNKRDAKEDGINNELYLMVHQLFDRDIIKKMFMPIIYGKSPFSTAMDLRVKLSNYMSPKEVNEITKLCFEYIFKK